MTTLTATSFPAFGSTAARRQSQWLHVMTLSTMQVRFAQLSRLTTLPLSSRLQPSLCLSIAAYIPSCPLRAARLSLDDVAQPARYYLRRIPA